MRHAIKLAFVAPNALRVQANNRWAQLVAEGEVSSTVLIKGVAMSTANVPTARECRQRAQACLLLATTSVDFYAQDALIELASDFENMADSLEQTKASNKG